MSENREMSVCSEMGHLELATSKMVALLEKLHAYVGDVLSGKVEGDIQVGRMLMEALSEVPNFPPAQFDTSEQQYGGTSGDGLKVHGEEVEGSLGEGLKVHWGRGC